MFVSGNMGINTAPNSDIVVDINSTNAMRLPKGQNTDRPVQNGAAASYKGLIRYNSEQDQFEGFGAGNSWGSLGGVIDVDQDTYVKAETSAGTDNDELQFYTAGYQRFIVDATGDASFNHGLNIVGAATLESTLRVESYMGINTDPSSGIVLDISASNAVRLPKGQNADRPVQNGAAASYKGLIRYNSEQDQFEGFGAGNAWGSLGGVKDVDQDTYITAETSAGTDNDQLQFYTAGYQRFIVDATGDASFNHGINVVGATTLESTLRVGNYMGINTDPSSGIVLDISASNAMRIPKGQDADRPIPDGASSDYKGLIRYNTEQDRFEGFGSGNAWAALGGGGVADGDADTYITAELTSGADDDALRFYTAGSQNMIIESTGDASFNGNVTVATVNSTQTIQF